MLDAVRKAGGEMYAITSEPQSLATNAADEWGTDMGHVGDPHQEIAGECARRGWLSLFTNHWGDDLVASLSSWTSHPKGYFQPGVLVLSREGRILYRWRCRPTRKNVGGATARPTATHVWARVQAALAEPAGAPDVAHDDAPELDALAAPWPLFVMLLLANGWFLRPAVFNYRPGEDSFPARMRNAQIRLVSFVAAWVVAAFVLPLWVVGLAFAAWFAKVLPGIRLVNARFQNVGPTEEPA